MIPKGRTFGFVAGLHRSGTTMLARALAEHPAISGFCNTGVTEDEGQFLQTVYPIAAVYGGPGLFGFSHDMHLTEAAPNANLERGRLLFQEWRPYWDMSCDVLVEKSPPNLIKMRYLQALFPNTRFITIIRHPIPASLAVKKWSRTSLDSLLRHWLTCHRLMRSDVPFLTNFTAIRYEDLVERPDEELQRLYDFLGVRRMVAQMPIRTGVNEKYLAAWRKLAKRSAAHRKYFAGLEDRFEWAVREFGYSLCDPEWRADRAEVDVLNC